jgi:hypothetical protein
MLNIRMSRTPQEHGKVWVVAEGKFGSEDGMNLCGSVTDMQCKGFTGLIAGREVFEERARQHQQLHS